MSPLNVLVVIPACNEEDSIADTIASIRLSIAHGSPRLVKATIVVVCDSCTDDTYEVAKRALIECRSLVLKVNFSSVGESRDWGVRIGLRVEADTRWVAFTDADSFVLPNWINLQVDAYQKGYDAFFGRVQFDTNNAMLKSFRDLYQTQSHRYIHGANMGLSLEAFQKVGGIPRLKAHEDRNLVDLLEERGLNVFWDTNEAVQTSVRMNGRAPEGFAATLAEFSECYQPTV